MISPSNTTSWAPTESPKQSAIQVPNASVNFVQPLSNPPSRISSQGSVAIMWDIENCPVPSDVRPEDVAGNIRMALRVHPVIKGAVTMFSAYGDFNAFPRRLREGCQRTGVKLVDVPNGRKDAADKAILVDMFLFALDNHPPSSIMLISGDVDFAPALHILGQRGYTVILVIPSGVGVSSALCNAGRFVWDWPSVARGEGFVPPPKPCPRGAPTHLAGFFMGCNISGNTDANEEEASMYRGLSQSYYNSRDFAIVSKSLGQYNSYMSDDLPPFTNISGSLSPPLGLNEPIYGSSADQNVENWVQPGDVNGLKGQLMKLLELSGGCLPLNRVPADYQKLFGRPLYISEYGAIKLVDLFKKMSDVIYVDGKGQRKLAYLRNVKGGARVLVPPSNNYKRGKGAQEDNTEGNVVCGSSDEFSEVDRMIVNESEERRVVHKPMDGRLEGKDKNLLEFKYELQEILVSFSCNIFLDCFEAIYQQRYKKSLNYQRFGVNALEELFEGVRDVVVLQEEPTTKKLFLATVSG